VRNLTPSSPALSNSPLPLDDVPNISQETAIFGTFRRQGVAQSSRWMPEESMSAWLDPYMIYIAENCWKIVYFLLILFGTVPY
jgi:hypothetical protein